MGVLIGDEPVFNLPSFVVAASDEIFDRLKNKIYERFNLSLRLLQGKTEKSRTSIRNQKSGEKTKVAGGNIFLDAFVFCSALFYRSPFLDIKKAGTRIPTFFYGFLKLSKLFSHDTKQYGE